MAEKFSDVRNGARPNSARASGTRSAGGPSLTCDSLAGWPTTPRLVHFVTYQIDSNSDPVVGTQLDCTGIVTSNTINSITVIDGNDTGNSVNDVVEMLPTANWAQTLAEGLTAEHNRDGTHKNITTDTLVVSSGTTLPAGDIVTADLAAGAVTFPKLAAGATRLGLNNNTGGGLTTSYVTFATVTATSTGGVCEAEFHIQANNANSGVFVTMDIQILCDGVAITPASLSYNLPYVSGASPNYSYSYTMSSTPAAGSHTWALQIKCNQNSTSAVVNNQIKVSEVV